MDDVLQLERVRRIQDEYGNMAPDKEKRQVFCQIESIDRTEHFEAGRNGLNPSMKFVIFQGDYNEEETVIYQKKTYSVYRTYRIPGSDYMELYVEKKGGVHG